MKEIELRMSVDCAHCGRKIGESKLPLFYRVRIERHALNLAALERQDGLARTVGSGRMATVIGPDEDMTTNLMADALPFTICEDCSTKTVCVAQLAEYATPVDAIGSSSEA